MPENCIHIYSFEKPHRIFAEKYHKHYTINVSLDYVECEESDENAIPWILDYPIMDKAFVSQVSMIIKDCARDYFLNGRNSIMLVSYVFEIFSLFKKYFRNAPKEIEGGGATFGMIAYVNEIKEYISNRMDKHITIQEIADNLNLSRG